MMSFEILKNKFNNRAPIEFSMVYNIKSEAAVNLNIF